MTFATANETLVFETDRYAVTKNTSGFYIVSMKKATTRAGANYPVASFGTLDEAQQCIRLY